MGTKVGDQAATAIEKYQSKYTEPVSVHTGQKVEGWFKVGEEALVILDVDRDDDTIVNPEITSESKVELIRLVNSQYID